MEELDTLIHHHFRLKPETVITETMRAVFQQGFQTGNFAQIAPLVRNSRNDTFNIAVTHDIDWLNPMHPYSLLNFVRSQFTKHKWLNGTQILKPDLLLRNIEQLLVLEKKLGIQAIYFIGASNTSTLLSKKIRYSYTSGLYKELLEMLAAYKVNIGLHASYKANQNNSLQKEKLLLSELTQTSIDYHRAHYIPQFSNTDYATISAAGFTHDFGLGSASEISFVNGFTGTVKAIDYNKSQTLNLNIVPLVLMDNLFFKRPCHQVFDSFKQQLALLKQNNGSANILFHPENMLLLPQLYSYFEEIIHLCLQEGATLKPTIT